MNDFQFIWNLRQHRLKQTKMTIRAYLLDTYSFLNIEVWFWKENVIQIL